MRGDPHHFDVVVVGAGPAGAACATILARAGRSVLLCDRARFPRNKICGDCVNPRCWPVFDRLGVSDTIEQRIERIIDAITVTNRAGDRTGIDCDTERPLFAIRRSVLDGILVDAAIAAGAGFRDETAVTRLAWNDVWRVGLRERGGHAQVTCGYVIGADGRNSTVSVLLGADHRRARPRSSRRRIGVQWHTRYLPTLEGRLAMYLFDHGYGGAVNVGEGLANMAMVTNPEHAAMAASRFDEFARRTFRTNPAARRELGAALPIGRVATAFPIDPRSQSIAHPRAELIGDARRTVEPFTGEGILAALEDGEAAADRMLGRAARKRGFTALHALRVNRVFSPILRDVAMSDRLVSLAADHPRVAKWLSRGVLGAD